MPIAYASFDTPSDALAAAVGKGLDDHNVAVAPSLSDVKPLAASATDDDGTLIGGALGRTWGLCCELQELWVAAEARHHGVGSALLRVFEHHARQRGCQVFYLTTLSYQAPGFYDRHGYQVIANIAGYPDGITKFLMLKAQA